MPDIEQMTIPQLVRLLRLRSWLIVATAGVGLIGLGAKVGPGILRLMDPQPTVLTETSNNPSDAELGRLNNTILCMNDWLSEIGLSVSSIATDITEAGVSQAGQQELIDLANETRSELTISLQDEVTKAKDCAVSQRGPDQY